MIAEISYPDMIANGKPSTRSQMGVIMWSLGVRIGLPILIVLAVALVLYIVYSLTLKRKWDVEGELFDSPFTGAIVAFVLLLIVIGVGLVGFYPYQKSYHYWSSVSGTVTDISNRILGDGNDVSQKFVVIIDGQEYGCNDTRCSLIKKGEIVTLSCKVTWQYSGTDGYDCNFVSRKPA